MSTRWAAAHLPDQSGRTAIVTGATSGLGLVTARELARVGARVVLAVRDPAKGERTAATMAGPTEVRRLDLADLTSVRAFAAGWTEPLDFLINNAGIMRVPQGRTRDGFELQFGTNHLGPFALTNLLLPHITSRVVTVSSQLHRRGRLDLDDLNWQRRRYRSLQAYCDSKAGQPPVHPRPATSARRDRQRCPGRGRTPRHRHHQSDQPHRQHPRQAWQGLQAPVQ